MLDGSVMKNNFEDSNFASSTVSDSGDVSDVGGSGIVISYCVKVTALFAAMGGEFVIDLPFKLLHPKPGKFQPTRHFYIVLWRARSASYSLSKP